MPQIFVLPEHIASQIAAGEVIERPASVVKELVENSIDAEATKIVVDVNEGCRSIRVADNGSGMEADDATLAFQRHATSKLTTADDLWNLHTLGFRGEALPSIASVSRLTCSTRTQKRDIGTKVVSLDGNMNVSETGCAPGTIIEVEDLFYNVPARLKFLKKSATEFAHIQEILQSLAITHPRIAFELTLDGSSRLKTFGSGDLDQVLTESNFLTAQATGQSSLINLAAKDGVLGLEIVGRLSSPTNFRGDRKGILTIVNNRPVRCSLSYKALDYAYADLIPRGRYPLAVVHLTVSPADLDINIHPTKKEIRYSRGNDVYLFIQRQIVSALREARSTDAQSKSVSLSIAPALPKNGASEQTDFQPLPESNKSLRFPSVSALIDHDSYRIAKSQQLTLREAGEVIYMPSTAFSNNNTSEGTLTLDNDIAAGIALLPSSQTSNLPLDWRVAGYIANTYILLETATGLTLVEQHIAHERVLYEKLLDGKNSVDTQGLIISLPLSLTEEQKLVLEENRSALEQQGFEFEIDNGTVSCLQVPVEIAHKDYAGIIQFMLQELANNSQADPKLEIVKSIACQSAIKNGMYLANDQIIELLNLWHNAPRNETCPHGRPIQLNFSYDKLFQMFHPA